MENIMFAVYTVGMGSATYCMYILIKALISGPF